MLFYHQGVPYNSLIFGVTSSGNVLEMFKTKIRNWQGLTQQIMIKGMFLGDVSSGFFMVYWFWLKDPVQIKSTPKLSVFYQDFAMIIKGILEFDDIILGYNGNVIAWNSKMLFLISNTKLLAFHELAFRSHTWSHTQVRCNDTIDSWYLSWAWYKLTGSKISWNRL